MKMRNFTGIFAVGFILSSQLGHAATTTRVSVNSLGQEATEGARHELAISENGRFVAFESSASNLVANDDNDASDVFVHDRKTGKTTVVSVNSGSPAISGDGRFVAFTSFASNLVPDDKNDTGDVFVHDRQTRKTTRVSVNSRGREGNGRSEASGFPPSISADGRFVAFISDASNLVADDSNDERDVFVHDRKTGETSRVSVDSRGREGHDESYDPAISADGRFVTFVSESANLVANDTDEDDPDPNVFVHDRRTKKTTRVSVNSLGEQGDAFSRLPAISARGRFVAFWSFASNLVDGDMNEEGDVFVFDRDRDLVNGHVTFEPREKTFRVAPTGEECGDGFVGRFLFKARLENTGDADLADLHLPVTELTHGNKLVTESDPIGPNGEFPIAERDDYSDGILGPGESVSVPLEVCLRKRKPFRLYVDIADDRKTKISESATPQAEFRFIVGLDRDDTLKGTSGDDMLIGFDGNDRLRGKGGDDLILGGRGNDELSGDTGNDEMRGGRGNDEMLGGGDADRLVGGSGDDTLNGGRNIDICKGGSGKDTLRSCEL